MPAKALTAADRENLVFLDDTTDFDVSLVFDGPDPDDTRVVLRQGESEIYLSTGNAIDAAEALLREAAPWKLR